MASSFFDPSWPGARVAARLGSWLLIREPAAHQGCRTGCTTGCSDLAALAAAPRLSIDWTDHQTHAALCWLTPAAGWMAGPAIGSTLTAGCNRPT